MFNRNDAKARGKRFIKYFAALFPVGKTRADGRCSMFNRNGAKARGKIFIKNLLDPPTLPRLVLPFFTGPTSHAYTASYNNAVNKSY
jgi:hypothetical protein